MTGQVSWLQQRLLGSGPPVIIDGGMGTELEKSGVPMNGKVWSAMANLSHPDAVVLTHEAFIRAGAEVIITNTFSAGRHMLEPAGFGDQVKAINHNAVKLARLARDNAAAGPVLIAGSICEWTTAEDSSWYQPEAVGRAAGEQAELMAEAGADLIAIEMCEQIEFSVAVVEAVLKTGLPLWIGVSAQSCENYNHLAVFDRPELEFETLVEALAGFPAQLMNIMHTPVTDVDQACEIVRRFRDGPLGVYPESGYFTMPNWQFVDVIEPEALVKQARAWANNGVRLLGGCCGLGPLHIAAPRQAFAANGVPA